MSTFTVQTTPDVLVAADVLKLRTVLLLASVFADRECDPGCTFRQLLIAEGSVHRPGALAVRMALHRSRQRMQYLQGAAA